MIKKCVSFVLCLCVLLGVVSVIDVPAAAAENISVEVKGFQRSTVVDETYSLRFICAVDKTEYSDLGMKIACSSEDGKKWNFDIPATELISQIKEDKNGEERFISAEEIGGKVLFTSVINNIPMDIGFFSATLTPYYSKGGIKKEGASKMVIMEDSEKAQQVQYKLAKQKSNIKIYGRSANVSQGIACDFTASGIEFNAKLAGDLSLKVNCSAVTYYSIYINGKLEPQRLSFAAGNNEYILAEDLPAGEYNIRLVKQTHVAHSISTLVSLKMYGCFEEKPQDDALMIEFIGDSITCGYGTVNYPETGVTYYGTSYYCDATKAYAFKTAEMLQADYSMISVSGWAVLPDGNGGSCIPNIYGKESYQRSSNDYTPNRDVDVVVIHLGTNDLGRSNFDADFISAAKEFISNVRKMNPNAKIVWAYGSMTTDVKLENKIKTVINALGGKSANLWSVKLPYDQSAGNGHPSDSGHTKMAETLASFIKKNCLN